MLVRSMVLIFFVKRCIRNSLNAKKTGLGTTCSPNIIECENESKKNHRNLNRILRWE